MQFDYRYLGATTVDSGVRDTSMSFVPDASREPTFFTGKLHRKLPFREAISALHHVVVSDMRYKPKDRSEYLAWRAQQEELDWEVIAGQRAEVQAQINALRDELNDLRGKSRARRSEFLRAQRRYFDYLYRTNYDAWFVLDPVITVHPDEIFFECFSQDESSYGRLSCSYEVFEDIGEFSCGTTNIDYSQALYNEFQKIRTYKDTSLEVDPTGFEVQTQNEDTYREVKIDLPDTWVRGFLQVSSAMTLPAHRISLHPMDLFNVCAFLRRFKEKHGPRSMRYHLKPGEPVRIELDPWGHVIECPRSAYLGDEEVTIRVWGRRRIHILERLIPIAKSFDVVLLGRGLPSFYVADLGDMTFTLGLSGWTKNDWSASGNFDLMAPRAQVDEFTMRRVFAALKSRWLATPDELAKELELDRSVVLGALGIYTQAGRVIFDLAKNVYRARELSRDPLPSEKLRYANDREASANALLDAGQVRLDHVEHPPEGGVVLRANVKDRYQPEVRINADERITKATCTCSHFKQFRLMRGPCAHMLAARLAYARQRDDSAAGAA